MMKFQHKFVDYIPDIIEDSILYISLDFGTIIHKCACGCGNEVNTPLAPTGWKMIYNGETVSLKPSIGNWSFDCKSHYWITLNSVEWSDKWSDESISKVRNVEDSIRRQYYRENDSRNLADDKLQLSDNPVLLSTNKSWFQKLIFWK